jgi:hypothetical protein
MRRYVNSLSTIRMSVDLFRERVRGEASAYCLAPFSNGGPINRICPLTEPNEAMAREAQMEEWFTASR